MMVHLFWWSDRIFFSFSFNFAPYHVLNSVLALDTTDFPLFVAVVLCLTKTLLSFLCIVSISSFLVFFFFVSYIPNIGSILLVVP